jgi:hypothetical protein
VPLCSSLTCHEVVAAYLLHLLMALWHEFFSTLETPTSAISEILEKRGKQSV